MSNKVNINIRAEATPRARVELVGKEMGLSMADAARLALTQFGSAWERDNKPLSQKAVKRKAQDILAHVPSSRKGR